MAGKHLSLLVHFIWNTAQREPWIGNDWRQPLSAYVGRVHAKRNILNFLADTELNTTSDTYGIDLCSPSGLNYILLSRSTT